MPLSKAGKTPPLMHACLRSLIEPLEGLIAPAFAAVLELSSLDGLNGFKVNGAAGDDNLGHGLSFAGDVNGDGFDDLILGADHADPNGSYSGASYVVFGKANGFDPRLEVSSLNGANGFKIAGENTEDQSGRGVSGAGDVNGDGFADLIVGAYLYGNDRGAAYVIFGKPTPFAATLNLSTLSNTGGFKITGGDVQDYVGFSVSTAGDVNADGALQERPSSYPAGPLLEVVT